jgi:dolichol-phosphate mannosyltransferase
VRGVTSFSSDPGGGQPAEHARAAETERPIVLIPTYNERENIETVLDAVAREQPGFDVLVIDDASPDGTGKMADRRAADDARVHVLHRPGKQGLGRAYLDGFRWALRAPAGYSHVCQLDADLSHDPRYLEALMQACRRGADVALGSRYVEGGGIRGWGPHRLLLSRGGSLYARMVLGVRIHDLTGGFKCWQRHVLEALPLSEVFTVGYGFQIEMTYRTLERGFVVVEVPIVFVDRTHGDSKMSMRIFWEGLTSVWKLRLQGKTQPRLDET